jgi:hypothetical protein
MGIPSSLKINKIKPEEIKVGKLEPDQKKAFDNLINKYLDIFAEGINQLGRTNIT